VGGIRGGPLALRPDDVAGVLFRGFAPGDRGATVRKRFRKLAQRRGVGVFAASSSKRLVLLGADSKRIRFIALLARGTSKDATRTWLDSSR